MESMNLCVGDCEPIHDKDDEDDDEEKDCQMTRGQI